MKEVTPPIRSGQVFHSMMAAPSHDDMSRQLFVQSFMNELQGGMAAGNATLWNGKAKAEFVRRHGREPGHISEIRKTLMREPYTQYWSSMKRVAREMVFDAVGSVVVRQLPELVERAKQYRDSNHKLGSLELDPTIEQPRYMSEVGNHCKPGGYHSEIVADDVFAGAEFDRTFHLVGQRPAMIDVASAAPAAATKAAGFGPLGDGIGRALAQWTKENLSALAPRKILDLGCTIGNSTLPWVDQFPDAEIHAIDVAAPCLRYAHARAEALGKKVHFSQQDAERSRFADGSFDLVLSHILLHELTIPSIHRIFKECHRLLRPGGYMLHLDIAPAETMDTMSQLFQLDWNAHYNAEPFVTKLGELDLADVAEKGGFARKATFHAYSRADGLPGQQHFFGAKK
ncbi:MAG: class I SAM-dependent methyltransferase [Alphaproteobacteria bacterium]|nr:class I SAM-dependent methyltransferase [Alphaproteobacteria bacterium]